MPKISVVEKYVTYLDVIQILKYAWVHSKETYSENEILSKSTHVFKTQYFITLDNFTTLTS